MSFCPDAPICPSLMPPLYMLVPHAPIVYAPVPHAPNCDELFQKSVSENVFKHEKMLLPPKKCFGKRAHTHENCFLEDVLKHVK